MRFFSKLLFICNICFIAAVIIRFIEKGRKAGGNTDAIIKLQPLENTLIVLGYSAIFLNIFFLIAIIYRLANGTLKTLPGWIVIFNLLIFTIQLFYFFVLP